MPSTQPKLIPIVLAFAITGCFALMLPARQTDRQTPFSTLDQTLHDLNASGLVAGNQR